MRSAAATRLVTCSGDQRAVRRSVTPRLVLTCTVTGGGVIGTGPMPVAHASPRQAAGTLTETTARRPCRVRVMRAGPSCVRGAKPSIDAQRPDADGIAVEEDDHPRGELVAEVHGPAARGRPAP